MYTHLRLPRFSARDPVPELAFERFEIIRMEAVGIVHEQKLFEGVAVILQDGLIGVKATPLPVQNDNVLRNGIDELPQFGFCLLPIMDVGSRRVPADNGSLFVPKRVETNQKPAILPIFSQ